MPRVARIVVPGYPHHITQRGTNKTDIFIDDNDRKYFLDCLKDYLIKTDTRVWAYCLMGNHFHLLLVPGSLASLGRCLHGTTFRYAQYFNSKYGRTGRLWQNRYFSCVVDKDEYLWAVARYIENNPLKARVVDRVEDWPWSSLNEHITGTQESLPGLNEWLDDGDRKKYHNFLKGGGSEESIRTATSTGRPLGGTVFFDTIEKLTGRDMKPKKGGRPRRSNS